MGFNNMNKGPPGKAFKDNKYPNEYRGDFRHKKNFNFKRKRDGYDRYQPDQRPKNENERPKPAFNIDRQDQDRRHGKPFPSYQPGNKSCGNEFQHGRPFNKQKGSFDKRYPVEGEAYKGTGFEQPRRLEPSNDIESRRSEKREEERREIHKKELHKKELARIEAERREEERKEAEKKENEKRESEKKESERKKIEKKETENKENEKKEIENKEIENKEIEKIVAESDESKDLQPEKRVSKIPEEAEKEAKDVEVNKEHPNDLKDNNTEEDFDMSTNYSSPLGPLPSANSSLSDKGLHEPDMVKLSTIVEANDNNKDYDSDVETIVSDSEPSTTKAREIGRELDPDSMKSNNSEVVKSSKGAKKPYTMKRDASGSSLLQRACKKGNLNEVIDLLERGADPNECDFCGFTCLHEAALNGDIEIVRYLISKGADVNKQALPDGDLETPLIDAADNGHYEIVKLLLESGADPLIYNNDGYTALTKIFNIHKDDEGYDDIIKILEEAHSKEKGAQKTNVSTARSPSPDQIVEDPNESYFKDLLKKKNHSSAIYKYAAEGVKDLAVQYIIEGGRLDYKPDIFILAARNGYVELVDILLGLVENFDINIQNACGLTALLASVGRNHLDVVKFLLERGADPFLRRKQDGFNALEISRKSPKFRAEEVELLENFMKTNPNYNVLTKPMEVTEREVDVPVVVNEKAPKLEPAPSKQSTTDTDKRVELKRKDSSTDIEVRKQKKQKNSPVESEPLTIKPQASSVFSKEKTPDANANATKDMSKSPQSHVERSKPSSPSPPPLSKKQEEMKAKNAMELKIYQEKLEAKKKARKDFFLKSEREKERKRKEDELKRLEEQKRLEILKQKQEEEKLKSIQQEAEKIVLQKKELERKQIQTYYPVGLQHVKFGTSLKKEDINKFAPLFTFEFDNEMYVTDLHISLITGGSISELRKSLKDSDIRSCSFEAKSKLWNIYFPLIGFYGPSNDLNKLLNDGHDKFQFLDIRFVKMDSVESFIKEKFQLSYDLIWKQKNFTSVDLSSLRMFRAIETAGKTVTNGSINADAVGSFIPPNLKSRPEVVKAVHDNKIPSW